jgi:tRNA pseudouridine38-40 synthase
VQGELEDALGRILDQRVELTVAGRTDAGVHAWGQVASFGLEGEPPEHLGRALNAVLPPEIAVLQIASTAGGFDARRDARSRIYCYWVVASPVRNPFHEGRALWWPHAADRETLDRCAAALVGTHDFTAFTPTQTEHVRFEREVIAAEWRSHMPPFALPAGDPFAPDAAAEDANGSLCFWVEADAFMRHMVRVLVGTMLEAAGGRRPVEDFEALLRGAPRERAGETAPAHGLYLAAVRY